MEAWEESEEAARQLAAPFVHESKEAERCLEDVVTQWQEDHDQSLLLADQEAADMNVLAREQRVSELKQALLDLKQSQQGQGGGGGYMERQKKRKNG